MAAGQRGADDRLKCGRFHRATMVLRSRRTRFEAQNQARLGSAAHRVTVFSEAMRSGRSRDNQSVRRPVFAGRPGACCANRQSRIDPRCVAAAPRNPAAFGGPHRAWPPRQNRPALRQYRAEKRGRNSVCSYWRARQAYRLKGRTGGASGYARRWIVSAPYRLFGRSDGR